MKPMMSSIRNGFGLMILAGFLSAEQAAGQEENLEMALADQNRRVAGINSLAKQVRGFFSWIPGMEEEEEDTGPPVEVPEVQMKEVKLIENQEATREAVDAVAEKARMEAEVYRQQLQAATAKINISGAFPRTKEIMVGAKRLGVGEGLAVQYHENLFQLEILDINKEELKLRDEKSKLEISISISVADELPPGMFRKPPPDQFQVAPASAGGGVPAAAPPLGLSTAESE